MEWCILTSFEKQSMSKWWFRHFKDPKNTCLPVVGHGTTFLTNVRVQILKNASNRDFIAMFTFSNHLNRLRSFKMLQSLVSSLTRSNTCNGHARCKRSIWSKQSSVTLQFFFFWRGSHSTNFKSCGYRQLSWVLLLPSWGTSEED